MDFNVTSRKRAAPSVAQGPGAVGADGRGVGPSGWKSSAGSGGVSACQLSMYDEAPVGEEVAMEQFEEFALDRLRVLKAIDDAKARGTKVDELDSMVPFEEVPDLVASRRVYLEKGFAFVPRDQLAAIVVGQFRAKLSKALVATNRKWLAHIQEDEQDRLTPVIEALSTRYLGPDFSQPGETAEVSLRDLDVVARQSFPLCMRHLFFKLREEHHLRHGGRMQLGLFLKGIGLRLEDALTFWRSEFSRKMGVERFDKEYAYAIRHNYGKEGKRTDYTPFSCVKVIMSTPGVGDHHGCPFKHLQALQRGQLESCPFSHGGDFRGSRGRDYAEDTAAALPGLAIMGKAEIISNVLLAGLSVAPLFVKINPNLNVVAMASLTVFAGCYRSVKPAAPAETMSKEHAMRFPIIGSCVLFSLFLLFKFLPKDLVNMVLSAYFVFLGVMAIGATILPLVARFVPAKWNEDIFYWKAPYFKDFEIELTMAQVVAGIPSAAFCVWYVTRKHWFANNALGLAFSLQGIEMLSLGSFTIGAILLTGLFFYDIFWVFFTPVMVSVAKSFDAPIKLLFPTGDLARPFSLLGLGDIVIPGIFVALALRFDVSRGTGPRYFVSTFAGYMAGIITTIFVMNYFQAAQKMDLGPCSREHSLRLRKEYEEAKAKGLVDYERELEGILEKLIVECDRKIQRSFKRLEDEEGAAALNAVKVSEVTDSPESIELTKKIYQKMAEVDQLEMENKMDDKIRAMEELEKLKQERADKQAASILDAFNKDRLSGPPAPGGPAVAAPMLNQPDSKTQEMIKEKLRRAEQAGEEGRVDEAQKLMEEADALKKLAMAPKPDPIASLGFQIADQKLRVCDICGAFLSIFDSDRRLADHFGGKLHLGYLFIRDKINDIREKRRKKDELR
ncbi:unnamed protein product [Closterium sp. Naga37s-1]|nr:unnamed protein product [Closterium sp. Naga37s-1]